MRKTRRGIVYTAKKFVGWDKFDAKEVELKKVYDINFQTIGRDLPTIIRTCQVSSSASYWKNKCLSVLLTQNYWVESGNETGCNFEN